MNARTLRLLVLTLVLGSSASAFAQRSAEEVLNTIIDAQRGGQTMRGTITMMVTRPGQERSYEIELISDGDARSLVRVVAPSRDAGQAFLRDGDNLFLYNPRLRRTLRLPPSGQTDAFLGSDLSYNDLAGRDLETDYTAAITAESEGRIELTLTPHPAAPTPYGQVVMVADGTTYAPLEYTFFDQRGQAVRHLSFADFVAVDDLHFPTRFTVQNLLRPDERTVMVISDYAFNVEVPTACFSERALERGC